LLIWVKFLYFDLVVVVAVAAAAVVVVVVIKHSLPWTITALLDTCIGVSFISINTTT
jgi:hypothetical protein